VRTTLCGLAVCLLLAGCTPRAAGSPTQSRPDQGRGVQLVPSGTWPVIKIGLVAPFEGRHRTLGYEVLYAVKLAVRERNAAGGVAGNMVELIALDDGDDPGVSSFQAYKFAVDGRVMGVVGPFSESTVQAAAPVYQELGLAAITPATCPQRDATVPGATEDGAVFCLGADAGILARVLTDRLPADARVTLLRAGQGALGDHLLSVAEQVLGAPRDAMALTAMRERPADVYLYDGDVLEAAALLIEMRQAGIDAPLWGGPAIARTQLSQIAGDAVAGACHALTVPLWADASANSVFSIGYQEFAGTAPGPWAALAYDGAVTLLDALERAIAADGHPTREGVIAALDETRGPDGDPAFDQGRRRRAEVALYCYEAGDPYPGTRRR
jgi:ABC-type branched-subunit amino acid transport system substrate-binding protein